MMGREKMLRCPVCNAGFRSTRICSRCGADLFVLMTLASLSQRCRANAGKAILSNDFNKAREHVAEAQKLHATEKGKRLLLLSSWLQTEENR